MDKIIYLMVAGSLGTLARYGISIFFNKYVVVNFPVGVFVNHNIDENNMQEINK